MTDTNSNTVTSHTPKWKSLLKLKETHVVPPPKKHHQDVFKKPAVNSKKVKYTPVDERSEKAALSYLYNFHSDRENWKFQKSRQNWIFRHALDLERIPPSFEPALIAYIQSAQGASKERLAKEASEMIKSKEEADPLEKSDLEAKVQRANTILTLHFQTQITPLDSK